MSDIIEVNISTLQQDCGTMTEKIASLDKKVKRLYDVIAELNGLWEGESKNVFLNHLQKDQNAIDELIQEAEKIANHMQEAVDIYTTCENDVSREIDAIRV